MSDMGRIYIVPDTIGNPDGYFEASERFTMEACYPVFIELVAIFTRGKPNVRLFLVCEADDTTALDWYASRGLVFPAAQGEWAHMHTAMMAHITQAIEKLDATRDPQSLEHAARAINYMSRKAFFDKRWVS
jgi:hypothetical protein